MSKWKKDWSLEKTSSREELLNNEDVNEVQFIKQKMRKIRKKRENPKNIPVFENIYERPQSSIIEGMTTDDLENTLNNSDSEKKDTGTNSEDNSDNAAQSDKEEVGKAVRDKLQSTTDIIGKRWTKTLDKKNFTDPIANLEDQLSSSIDNLSNLQDIGDLGGALKDIDLVNADEFASTVDNIKETFKIDKKRIEKIINEVSGSMKSLSKVFAGIFSLLAQKIHQAKIYIQLFILRINKYIDDTLVKIANALTQNTATEKEIEIFKDQAQKFTTMMLVWYFVYNWYYIVFFIEKEDGILYEFDAMKMKNYNTYLYGAFGPAYRVLESFNWCILKCSLLKKYIPTPIIMVLMFFIFYILVSNNFQSTILMNFFNAMRGKFSTSILSLISIFIVLRYSIGWFFGKEEKGDMEMHSMVSKQQTIFSICFFLVLFCISLLGYMMWTIAVNIPLAMFMISAYLTLYTFFGVIFYEGINAGMIITGITNSIDMIEPNLTEEGCNPEDVRMGTWLWWKGLIPRFIDFIKEIINFCSLNMFEILIFLMLIGGIGLYKKEWNVASQGKVGLGNNDGGLMSPDGLKNIFKHLFVWLVIINILLILILGKFLYDKYLFMLSMKETVGRADKSASGEDTNRAMLAAQNPTMMSSSRGIKRYPVSKPQEKPIETETKSEEKPIETKSEEKPVETKSEEKPIETKSEEKPIETKSEEKPVETKYEEKPIETKSEEKPVETE